MPGAVAGTKVYTKSGLKNIEEIEAGDLVWSRDEFTMESDWRPVMETFITHPEVVFQLTYQLRGPPVGPAALGNAGAALPPWREETLGVTAPHPFYVISRSAPGFVPAEELLPGDLLQLANGDTAAVVSNQRQSAPADPDFATYNFEVADFHTYFVGEAGVWVHNEGAFCQKLFAIFNKFHLDRFAGNLWAAYRHVLTGPGRWFRTLPARWKLRLFNDVRRKHLDAPGAFTAPWHDLSNQILTPIPAGSTMPAGWVNGDMARELEKNVKAALGVERPDFAAALHHIIPHSDNNPNGSGANLRALLQSKGIHPNEAVNGLYLPRSAAVADLNPLYGPRHLSLHTNDFLDKMWLRLQVHTSSTPAALRNALQQMAADIVDGTFLP